MTDFLDLWEQFRFLRPSLLILLIVPLLFGIRFFKNGTSAGSWEKICDPTLLNFLLIKGRKTVWKLCRILFVTALTVGILAAAGPSWRQTDQKVLATVNPTMFLLSLSSDMQQDDVTPTRLERAKIELSDVLKSVSGGETGLIVYSDEPFIISPLSNDPALIENLSQAVDFDIMPSNGDRTDRAVDLAVERIKSAGFSSGQIVILASEAGMSSAQTLEAVRKAVNADITVSVIDLNATPSDELKNTARKGNGVYAPFAASAPQKIADFINHAAQDDFRESEKMTQARQDDGYGLVFVVMACLLPLFRRGILIFILMFFFAVQAEAGWFVSDAYKAQKAFDQGDYETAARLFTKPSWKGSAAYRSGRYGDAVSEFESVTGTEALYNKGNALAKDNRILEAIEAYEAVLKEDPNHEDAKFNLEYLKQQQQQQKQQNNSSDSKQDQQDQQNQKQNQDGQGNNSPDQNQDQNQDQNSSDQNQDSQNQSDKAQSDSENQNSQGQQNSEQSADTQEKDDSSDLSDSDSNDDNTDKEQKDQSQNGQQLQPEEKQNEQNAQSLSGAKQDDKDKEYNEQVQARAQRFRDIPEDKGGLLRAFIRREYNKNRYGE
jgi:Ca-activated chloride channel family protein